MWYGPLGFVLTFIIGLSLSYCWKLLFKEPKVELDPNLFFPIIGNRIRRRHRNILEANENDTPKDQRKYMFTINLSNDAENANGGSTTKL